MLMMPGMAMAKGVQVVELQSYEAVQFMGVVQGTPAEIIPPNDDTPPNDTPPNDTPPNDTPPNDTPPDTPPEVPPNTPPDTPREYPPETPPETPPEESCETPPSTTQGEASYSGSRKVLPYTGGNSLLYQLLGLVLVLLGFGGLIGSMSVSKKKQA